MNIRLAWIRISLGIIMPILFGLNGCGDRSSMNRPRAAIGDDVRRPSESGSIIQHYEYVFPDGWIYVYDIDNGHAVVESLQVPTTAGVRGVAVSPGDGMLYISYGGDGGSRGNGSMLQFSLLRDSIGWNRHYSHGIDSHAITPDGTTIYMPSGELAGDGRWYIINAADGTETGSFISTPGLGPHNTIVSADGKNVYMGDRNINEGGNDYFYVASTSGTKVTKRVGPLLAGVRPFTINGTETIAYVTASNFLGFQVCDLRSNQVLYIVDLTTMGFPKTPCLNGTCATAPSHGISLSPDEREIYVIDFPNSYVHVFDVSGVCRHVAPKKVADIQLQHSLVGNESGCAYDCLRDGWVQHSVDGRYVYVGDSGDVIDTQTHTIVAYVATLRNTRKMLEIDWQNGHPVQTTTRTGVGKVADLNICGCG